MAKSSFVRQNTDIQNLPTFSDSEMDAATQLIQLSSSRDSDGSKADSSSVQGKPDEQCKVDCSDVTSKAANGIIAEAEEEEEFGRRNKRYRYIEDLYNVTEPVSVNVVGKPKRKKNRRSMYRK